MRCRSQDSDDGDDTFFNPDIVSKEEKPKDIKEEENPKDPSKDAKNKEGKSSGSKDEANKEKNIIDTNEKDTKGLTDRRLHEK